jgi:saxitoxin biosynthesis operon SxtJ-like protein
LVSIDWNPKPRSLRQFALAAGVFCALATAYLWQRRGDIPIVWTIGTLGVTAGLLGSVWPETVRYVYIAVMVATYPLGWLMSHIVLGVIYYGVFTPLALWFRLTGRDVLQRRFDPAAYTYWQPRRPAPPASQYLRQF